MSEINQFARNWSEAAKEFALLHNCCMKDKIYISCSLCKEINFSMKEKIMLNIEKNGHYQCKSCGLKEAYKKKPISQETKNKISSAHIGKKFSLESRQKMSESKKALFKTEHGLTLKNKLALKAIKQHSEGKFLKGNHLKGYYNSKKSGPTYYASSYELRCQYLLDQDESILSFKSQIPIEINNKHRCIDLLITYTNGSKEILEIKPEYRFKEAKIKNQINDIKQYSEKNNYKFKVWTERDSNLKNDKEIYNWAVNFIKETNGSCEFDIIRKENRKQITKRRYEKVKNNKITIYCEFCKEEHTIMQLSYDINIKKNEKYICHKQNSCTPKIMLKKENPYQDLGMKECTKCHKILEFSNYHKDKNRRDGLASRCKTCRCKNNDII